MPDAVDRDDDGNGVDDDLEEDSDRDGRVDRDDDDDDNDARADHEDGDRDGNGVPDRLENDSDQDGHTDGEEFISGTNPNNPTDIFILKNIDVIEDGKISLKWASKAGKVYQLQGSESLHEGIWINLGDRIVAEGEEVAVTVGDDSMVLHRVVLIR